MKNLIYCIACVAVLSGLNSCSTDPQKEVNNILLPSKLLVADNVPFDSMYLQSGQTRFIDSATHPVFNYKPLADFPELITQKALEGKIAIYNPDAIVDWEPNPKLEPISDTLLRIRLGEVEMISTMLIGDSMVEQKTRLPIELHQMVSLYTIEEWSFTAQPLKFAKKVNMMIPVRRYQKGNMPDEYRFMKTICFVNPKVEKAQNLQPLANIDYEFVFNLHGAFLRNNFNELISGIIQSDECFSEAVVSSYNAPWFNAISQQKLVNELLTQVFEGKAKAVDFESGKPLSAEEAQKRILAEDSISYIDEDGFEQTKTVLTDRTTDIRSVIFSEEWFYNPQTLYLEKKVTGISPVFYTLVNEQHLSDVIHREIPFKVLMQ